MTSFITDMLLCSKLTTLELSWLNLKETPSFVLKLSHLQHLNLKGNDLQEIPLEVAQLPLHSLQVTK